MLEHKCLKLFLRALVQATGRRFRRCSALARVVCVRRHRDAGVRSLRRHTAIRTHANSLQPTTHAHLRTATTAMHGWTCLASRPRSRVSPAGVALHCRTFAAGCRHDGALWKLPDLPRLWTAPPSRPTSRLDGEPRSHAAKRRPQVLGRAPKCSRGSASTSSHSAHLRGVRLATAVRACRRGEKTGHVTHPLGMCRTPAGSWRTGSFRGRQLWGSAASPAAE